ncbi:DUF2273 domain-containing protein [Lactococcus hircilactis]|uniref:DUF2273 domain-containing protein n=1 Tax=Lactococcus hircilactis TaxID=1494462 RepID=A0A7X2D164_9LACT|nr:DUF2273 domain-containing protein [Lactococcus hircilactis]MQW40689.1 DUF2273 domain-containing protein [Lactococcus hircilactis]
MNFFNQYKYPIIGGTSGLLLAICFFTFGFWKTILMLLLILIGIFVGLSIQQTDLINRIFKK